MLELIEEHPKHEATIIQALPGVGGQAAGPVLLEMLESRDHDIRSAPELRGGSEHVHGIAVAHDGDDAGIVFESR